MSRAGNFRASRSEVSFGLSEDSAEELGQYEIELSDGRTVSLAGKIDRLDIAQIDDEKAAIVFDYKRIPRTFNWSKFYYGLDMQLPIYMLALRNSATTQEKIVGAFYMPVDVAAKKASPDEVEQMAETPSYKAKGIFDGRYAEQLDGDVNSAWSNFYNFRQTKKDGQYGNYNTSGVLKTDDFEKVLHFAGSKIFQLAQDILSGTIDVHPYRLGSESPCQWCDYRSVCRFDWQTNNYNSLATVSKPAVLESIGAGDG
jgi:ATP-dependent helicase/nuclease subunit B